MEPDNDGPGRGGFQVKDVLFSARKYLGKMIQIDLSIVFFSKWVGESTNLPFELLKFFGSKREIAWVFQLLEFNKWNLKKWWILSKFGEFISFSFQGGLIFQVFTHPGRGIFPSAENKSIKLIPSPSRWWFHIFSNVHPYLGKVPILTNVFQMGWKHQLVIDLFDQIHSDITRPRAWQLPQIPRASAKRRGRIIYVFGRIKNVLIYCNENQPYMVTRYI